MDNLALAAKFANIPVSRVLKDVPGQVEDSVLELSDCHLPKALQERLDLILFEDRKLKQLFELILDSGGKVVVFDGWVRDHLRAHPKRS